MFWLWPGVSRSDRVARAALRRLSRRLAKESQRQIGALVQFSRDPGRLETLFGPLRALAEAQAEIARTLQNGCTGQAAAATTLLRQLSQAITESLQAEPWVNYHARQALSRILEQLLAAHRTLLAVMQPAATAEKIGRVVVAPELLHEVYRQLFPAERMLVVAGRRMGETTRLINIMDVTGDQSGGHVRANPDLLGRALIGMSESDTFLAAWVHSHPGLGPGATHPSPTDLRQHQDWIRHYPSLLSIIVVKDGWVRFWGTALETRRIEVELLGHGLIRETAHGYVYRLNAHRRLSAEPGDADTGHRDRDGTTIAPQA